MLRKLTILDEPDEIVRVHKITDHDDKSVTIQIMKRDVAENKPTSESIIEDF